MNFIDETIDILKENNKSMNDVVWIGNTKYKISIENFIKISNINYDNSYGSPKIAQDLLIVGNDFWLERHEYDGSEWWEFKQIPKEPQITKEVKSVETAYSERLGIDVSCGWNSLDNLNGIKDQ